jgi:Na+-translocating ferredoxin:NAD+ oxidoreductase RnfG subunit
LPIRVGKDIDAITGATLSSKAMSGGVRDAIRLVRKLATSSHQ